MANKSTKSANAKKPTVKGREVRDLKPRKDPMGGYPPRSNPA
jgi:hypothetical protein